MPHLWLTHGEYIDKPSTFQQSVYIYIGITNGEYIGIPPAVPPWRPWCRAQVSAIALSSVLGALARQSRWSEALEALERMHCAQRGEEQMHQVP